MAKKAIDKTYQYFRVEREDLKDIVDLAADFFEESDFFRGRTNIRKDTFFNELSSVVDSKEACAFCAREKETGELAGYILGHLDGMCSDPPFLDLYQFYVRKKYRSSYVGLNLINVWLDEGKKKGAFAACFNASGAIKIKTILDDFDKGKHSRRYIKSMIRYLKRSGFDPVGVECVKYF